MMTVRGYAHAYRLTAHQVFSKAWRERYSQTPNFHIIQRDVDTYLNYGALPPYVAFLLEKESLKPMKRYKNYFAYWARV